MKIRENPAGQGGVLDETADYAVPAVDSTGPQSAYVNVSPEHAAELFESAVSPVSAASANVRTAYETGDLPEPMRWVGDKPGALPALVYPMREVDGTPTWQVKPQPGSVTFADGRSPKYVGPSKKRGHPPQLPFVGVVLEDGSISADIADLAGASVIWIVEGNKQALAALSHAPKGVAVLRITGVYGWMVAGPDGAPGTATNYLRVVSGKRVIIFGDADARTNPSVYDGLTELGGSAREFGARSVAYAQVPGVGTQGLDDVLAGFGDDVARRAALADLAKGAMAKPAPMTEARLEKLRKDRDDKRQRAAAERTMAETSRADRPDVSITGSWHDVAQEIAATVAESAGGSRLFSRGGVVMELVVSAHDAWRLRKCDGHNLHRQLLSACRPIVECDDGPMEARRLDRDLIPLVSGWLEPALPRVSRIAGCPVVREDGSVVLRSGFDSATGALVNLPPSIEGLPVRLHPTDDDIAGATHLLRDVLFERDGVDGYDGWLFESETDRTNTIALLLTCLLRSAFPTVPLVVFDGLQRGVGKGTVAKVIVMVAYGVKLAAKATPAKDAEMEKRIISDLLAGLSVIMLDEVMGTDGSTRLASPSLQTALTTDVMGGRKLGVSESLELVQAATWMATGNNVDYPGDMVRRILPVRLTTDRPNPDRRNNFRMTQGPVKWAEEHRAELLTAALTLIRAWFDRGCPPAPKVPGEGMGDFVEWESTIGGILHLAGIEGFAANVAKLRDEGDSEALDNHAHLVWVESAAAKLATAPRFSARDIMSQAAADPHAVAPHDRRFADLDSRDLGRAWKHMCGRWFGTVRIVEDGFAHGNVRAWRVESAKPPTTGPSAPVTPPSPAETMRVKGHDGRVTEHVRVMPEIDGLTVSELGGGDQ